MLGVAVGVAVYNEAENLGRLLTMLRRARGPHLDLRAIVVVSSGSTDATVEIARAHAAQDPRVQVLVDQERRGKATAINQFLAAVPATASVCVLCGGDTLPTDSTLDRLVAPFRDRQVGMTGAHPVPTNAGKAWVDRLVRFLWALHHEVALGRPKMGELIAFRPDLPPLDPQTAVDEAAIELLVLQRGERIVYVPEATVLNQGPSDWRELLNQRRRIWTGHYLLRRNTGYEVSTMPARHLLVPALRLLRREPSHLPAALLAAALEALARALGTLDAALFKKNPYVWDRLATTKRPDTAEERPQLKRAG